VNRFAPLLACGLLPFGPLAGCRADALGPYPNASVILVSIDTLRADRLPLYG